MPTWPTLWPKLAEGQTNIGMDSRIFEPVWKDKMERKVDSKYNELTTTQKQLLYECEEERMLVKACMRDLIKLKRSPKHTSWDTADAANMGFT
jgi:hypothetical protein